MSGIGRWLGRGFWALADRGIFSVSNFILNILLARWLSPDGYGAFAVAFTLFLLFGAVHSGLLTEPMLVFGPSRHEGRFGEYLGVLLAGHIAFAVGASTLLVASAVVAAALGWSVAAGALLALAAASPFILLQWLVRMACYVELEPRPAALAGIVYLVLVIGGAVALHELQSLSGASALLLMGAASLVSAIGLLLRLRPKWPGGVGHAQFRSSVLSDHWTYGRWAAGTGILTWIPSQVYYLVLPVWGGLSATASLRALMNLIMPIIHGYQAVALLLTTALARERHRGFRKIVAWSLFGFTGLAVVYWVSLGVGREMLIDLVYGGRYAESSQLLWLVGLIPVVGIGGTVLAPALRALERPDRVFVAYAASTVAALTVGLILTVRGGPAGAALAILISTGLVAGILGWQLRRTLGPGTRSEFDSESEGA